VAIIDKFCEKGNILLQIPYLKKQIAKKDFLFKTRQNSSQLPTI
jgi:hypothetical protein